MRVSVVNSLCRSRDAIGESVHATCRAVIERLGWECRLFTSASDFDDVATTTVTGPADLLQDPYFAASDVHMFHFGFHSSLFTLLGAGTARTKRIVRFHNVTPKQFVPEDVRPLIDMSLDQIALMDFADEVWADSPYNRNDLVQYGIPAERILVEPLFGKAQYGFTGEKPRGRVNLLYVGRFVGSKGVLDLVEAMGALRRSTDTPVHLELVGSKMFSNSLYTDEVRARISALGLDGVVTFVGELDEEALMARYHAAHLVVIPSYHEGFCVPLVEALHARAIPVAYGAGNVPFLLNGVGEIVPTGDIGALTSALTRLCDWHQATWQGGAGPLELNGVAIESATYATRVATQAAMYTAEQFQHRVAARLRAVTSRI